MFDELLEMDHSELKKVTIKDHTITLEFKSGNVLQANCGSKSVIEDFKKKMMQVLRADQIEVI